MFVSFGFVKDLSLLEFAGGFLECPLQHVEGPGSGRKRGVIPPPVNVSLLPQHTSVSAKKKMLLGWVVDGEKTPR
jgi:hypothetical protein